MTDLPGYSIIIKKKKIEEEHKERERWTTKTGPSGNILPHFFGRCTIFKCAVEPSNQESGTLGCCGHTKKKLSFIQSRKKQSTLEAENISKEQIVLNPPRWLTR